MGSRVEKVGSIYSRLRGLLKNKGIMEDDKPLWFDIYTHFPPEREPTFTKQVDTKAIKEIFYPEDKVRAKIHAALSDRLGIYDMNKNDTETVSQKWIKMFNGHISEGASEDEALQKLKDDISLKKFPHSSGNLEGPV